MAFDGMTHHKSLLDRVAAYYAGKVDAFGPTAEGVDWKDAEGQYLRFDILTRLFGETTNPSVVEIGCGYGAFVDYCDQRNLPVRYVGYDVSAKMISKATERFGARKDIAFFEGSVPTERAQFAIASGIFNVRVDTPLSEWREYVVDTIDTLAQASTLGFAFNCLTGHADPDRMQERLFYPKPGEILDHCVARYGRGVVLAHDYDLYEFTVLIRK